MRVRDARTENAEAVAALGARSYRDHFAALWDARELDAWLAQQFDPGAIRADVEADRVHYLLADVDGREVGFAKLIWDRAVPAGGGHGAELQKIYFLGDEVGRGYGAALIEACADRAAARGEACVWLDVLKSNERARRLYERRGFSVVGERDHPLEKRQILPMWVMRRPLGVASDR
jgi:ribosomal protein S18 acetylase RimI-like enzyme